MQVEGGRADNQVGANQGHQGGNQSQHDFASLHTSQGSHTMMAQSPQMSYSAGLSQDGYPSTTTTNIPNNSSSTPGTGQSRMVLTPAGGPSGQMSLGIHGPMQGQLGQSHAGLMMQNLQGQMSQVNNPGLLHIRAAGPSMPHQGVWLTRAPGGQSHERFDQNQRGGPTQGGARAPGGQSQERFDQRGGPMLGGGGGGMQSVDPRMFMMGASPQQQMEMMLAMGLAVNAPQVVKSMNPTIRGAKQQQGPSFHLSPAPPQQQMSQQQQQLAQSVTPHTGQVPGQHPQFGPPGSTLHSGQALQHPLTQGSHVSQQLQQMVMSSMQSPLGGSSGQQTAEHIASLLQVCGPFSPFVYKLF